MESIRLVPLIAAAALAAPAWLHSSGGGFDVEPPHNLAGDLDRLPAKPLAAILLEIEDQKEETDNEDSASSAALPDGFLDRIGKEKPEKLAAEIDKLVSIGRAHYDDNKDALPMLYDLRDAIISPGPSDEAKKAYCQARAAQAPEIKEDAENPAQFAKDDPLRPHLLYQQGAARFAEGDREKCAPWFREIVGKYPKHPRAEGALFLLARCALSASRADDLDEANLAITRKAALSAFQDYLKQYPNGRYSADAHGWIGALLWEDQPAEALKHYLAQFDDPAHPECRRSAAHMIERVLARMVGKPDELNRATLKVLAQHPLVAQAAVYFVLNAPEVHPWDGKYDDPAALKAWRLRVLPMLASAVAEEKPRYAGPWSLRLRAMLAQAASAEGKQDEALKLTGEAEEELKSSDDLLFARVVALQRARRAPDAAKAARLFLETFPESKLIEGVRIRLAQSLIDTQRAGDALLVLGQIQEAYVDRWHGGDGVYPGAENEMEEGASAVYPDTQGYDAFEDLKTSIIEFAPLAEVEAVLKDPAWESKVEDLSNLKNHLAWRKASREDFAGAAALLKDLADEPGTDRKLAALESLAALKSKAEAATAPDEKARLLVVLADAFAAQATGNGPLSTEGSNGDWLVWRSNARTLGYKNLDEELEQRHPLRHATKYWLEAARLQPGTPLSAQARLKVLEGLESIALTSEYDFARASETNMNLVSRQIYDVLVKENPATAEAKAAAWFDFAPAPPDPNPPEYLAPPPEKRGQPGYGREVEAVRLLGGYRYLPYDAFGEFPECHYGDETNNPVLDPIREKLEAVAKDLAGWEKVITPAQVETWLKQARPAAENAEQVKVVNLLEDLNFFLKVEGLPDEFRQTYVQARLRAEDFPTVFIPFENGERGHDPRPSVADLVKKLRAAPEAGKVADFLDYLELYFNEADRGPDGAFEPIYPTYDKVEKGCRAFLEKYPKSVRREACYVLLMRAVFRQMPERWIHAKRPEGAEEGEEGPLVEWDEPYEPAELLKAIADYEKEFPQPRYAAEVRNFRGHIAWRTGDYKAALDLTLAQLEDQAHLDLRREAAVRLANIFADLRDHRHCPAVLAVVKASPKARKRLEAWLVIAPEHADHPLRCRIVFTRHSLEN